MDKNNENLVENQLFDENFFNVIFKLLVDKTLFNGKFFRVIRETVTHHIHE